MVTNQKRVKVNKPKYDEKYLEKNGAFMQIGIEEWQEAFKLLKGNPSAFAMYLYLASNTNGYIKELSAVAFENAVGKSRTSYHRAIGLLTELGYIYEDSSSRLNFATKPKVGPRKAVQNWERDDKEMKQSIVKNETEELQNCNTSVSELTTETNNTNSNKENIEINITPSIDYSYLKKEVDSEGNFDDTSFAEIIPRFEKIVDFIKPKRIAEATRFSEEEANYIVNEILSDRWRTNTLWKSHNLF